MDNSSWILITEAKEKHGVMKYYTCAKRQKYLTMGKLIKLVFLKNYHILHPFFHLHNHIIYKK